MMILETIVSVALGIVCIVFGISHTKGNFTTLHSYHYHRVTEEDRLPFGRLIGLGTIVMGGGIALFGIFNLVATLSSIAVFSPIATVLLIAALVVGGGLAVYALLRYNHGIF